MVKINFLRNRVGFSRTYGSLNTGDPFHQAFKFSASGMALLTINGNWIKVNQSLCDMLGYTENELLETTFQALTHPDDLQNNLQLAQKLVAGDLLRMKVEKRYRHKLGHYIWCKLTTSVSRFDNGDAEFFISQIEDITEQKQAREVLIERARLNSQLIRMQQVFEHSTNGLFFTDVLDDGRFKIVEINPAFTKESGVTDEYINMAFDEQTDSGDDSIKFIVNKYREVVATKQIIEFEICYNNRITHTKYVPVLDGDGKVEHIIGISTDITEQRKSEEALFARKQEYRSLVENSPDIITRYNRDLHRIYANPEYLKFTGFSESEALGVKLEDKSPLPANIVQSLKKLLQKVFESGVSSEMDMEWTDSQNRFRCFYLHAVPEYNKNGQVESIMTIARNITERRQMEEALRKSEEQYRLIAENTADIISLYDLNFKPIYVSPSVQKLLGFTVEEAMQRSVEQIFTADSLLIVKQALVEQMALENEGNADPARTVSLVVEEYCKNGSTIWVEISATFLRDSNLKPTGFTGITRDITERKQAEQALNESQALAQERNVLLQNIIESSPDLIVFSLDTNYNYLLFNQKHKEVMHTIWGKDISIGGNMLDVLGDHPDREVAKRVMDRTLTGESFVIEEAYGNEALLRQYWQNHWSPIRSDAGKVIGLCVFCYNITERKCIEEELKTSEQEYRSLAENSPDNIIRYNRECRATYGNHVVKTTMDDSAFAFLGKTPLECYPNGMYKGGIGEIEEYQAVLTQVLLTGESKELEMLVPDLTGSLHNYLVLFTPERDSHGNIVGVIAFGRDITERKQLEFRLKESLTFVEKIINSIPEPVFIKDRQHRFILSNDAHCSYFGHTREEILGKTDFDFYSEQEAKKFMDQEEVSFESGIEYLFEDTITDIKGNIRNILVRKTTFVGSDGNEYLAGTITDVSRLKTTENQLKEAHIRLKTIFSTIPDLVWMKDTHGKYLACNKAFELFFGATELEIVGKTDHDFVDAELADFFRQKDQEAIDKGSVSINDETITYADDGRKGILETRKVPIADINGNFVAVLGIGRDITERKQMEEANRHLNADMAATLQAIPDLLFEVDRNCTYIDAWANDPALLVFHKELLLGKTLIDVLSPEAAQTCLDAITEAEDIGNSYGKTICIDLPANSKWFELSVSKKEGYDEQGGRFIILSRDITDRKMAEDALRESEQKVQRKLNAILSPNLSLETLELSDIIDVDKIQDLLDKFNKVSKIAVGIIDAKGKMLVESGWQEICTKFHRGNPDTCSLCNQSKMQLSNSLPAGIYKEYKCYNNMYDIATPIIVGGKHMGNMLLAQFLYDDEAPDLSIFQNHALRFGFNEQEYMDALNNVPRWSRESINAAVSFHAALADLISSLSYSTLKLANALEMQKTLETQMRQQNEFQQLLLNALRDTGLILLVVENGKIIYNNDFHHGSQLGYAKGDFPENPDFTAFVHPDDRELLVENHKKRITGEPVPNSYEIGALTKNGERREYELFATVLPNTNPPQIVALKRDVTQRKLSEKLLLENQSKLSEAQRIGRIGSWELDIVSHKLEWSAEVFRIFEIDTEQFEATYEAFIEAIHPDDREMVNRVYVKSVKEKSSYDVDHRLLFPGGRIKYVSQHGITFYDNQGKPLRSIGTVRDMTRRKEAELELISAKEKAEESNRLKSAFLATMNHELRTPLNAIMGFSELLKYQPEKTSEYIDYIYNSGSHLLEIIEDIFMLTLAEQSKIVLRNKQFILNDFFIKSKQVLSEILENSGKTDDVELIFSADTQLLSNSIFADQTKINQVLSNLFRNAVKFINRGHIEFGIVSDKKGWLTFYVSDTGIGIPDDKKSIIFDFFRQANETHCREHGGVGIGLTISKRITEIINGKLNFVSTLGSGSTFYFSIPVEPTFGVAKMG